MRFLLSLLLLFANGFLAVSAQSPSAPENPEKQVDSFVRTHNERRAKNPEGLLFTVRLKDNRKQFHFGEVITLELSFASSKPEAFTLDAATYDRSGRLNSDSFALDRSENAVDPLTDYFYSGLQAFPGGGIRAIPVLTVKPHVIPVELNEWQRIEKPGHYRLYVVSSRLGTKARGNTFGDAISAVVSNVIEFDVLPEDKKWSTQKLNEAISVLAKPGGEHRAACRALRFLGTTAAATEMRKRFRGDDRQCEWEYKFGLIGSPHRDYVIRDMENAISLREQPVTLQFIRTLALLEFTRRVTASPSPYPAGNEEQIKQWQIEWDRRQSIFDELQLQYVRQLAMATPQKQGQARATSLQTLLDSQWLLSPSEFSRWSTLVALMPEVFKQLPLKDQLRVLQYQWKPVASAAMLPVLRDVFRYSYPPDSDASDDFHRFHQEDLRSVALRRLYELSPEEGRRLILEEIRRPEPRVNEKVLDKFPDEPLPELNTVLLSNFENARQKGSLEADEISELIERYATDEILPRVQAVFDARVVGKLECRPQTALLAYFLRVAPSVGGEYLNKALAARGEGFTQCYKDLLRSVAKLHMSAEVEEVATAALDDEDYQVVLQAAKVLAEYGSAEAEKALWRRMEKWHELNRSKQTVEELGPDQVAIEAALREALTSGHAWLSDPEKLKRLRELCLTGTRRNEVDEKIRGWNNQIHVSLNSHGDESITIWVANCELRSLDSLKAKLLQFPKGTVFKYKTAARRGDEDQSEEVFQQIKNFVKEHGMDLERQPEQ